MDTGKSPAGDDSVDSDQDDPSLSSTNSYRSKKMKLDNGAPRNSGHSSSKQVILFLFVILFLLRIQSNLIT